MGSNLMIPVSFVGAGNIAWHLAPAFENLGVQVTEVTSLSGKSARELVKRLYNADQKEGLDFSDSPSRIIFVCVPDDAIEEVAREIVLPESTALVHTSGTTPLDILDYAAPDSKGVFYPFQTFSKSKKPEMAQVPFFVEADDRELERTLLGLGKGISRTVKQMDSRQRAVLHLAGIFAGNFANHMITLAEGILKDSEITTSYLYPLVAETINKTLEIGPYKAQTGPALRRDEKTLTRHLEMLQEDPDLARLYDLISLSIMQSHPTDQD